MKKCLVTGADGFIGSHLCEHLIENGYQVKALVQYNSFNSWGWLDDSPFSKNIEVIAGDIRDSKFCDEITKDIETVFHLAALIAIPYSYIAPESYVDTNVKGTLNMCHAAYRNGVKRFIHTSTSEVYGSAQYVPIDEKHPLQPQSPYSASKIAADAMAMSFFYSFKFPVTVARPFNTYGPRQSARAVIPTIISQIASGSRVIKLGDLKTTRDFNFVKDTCAGFLALLKSESTIGKTINIGSNTEISIEDLVRLISKIMNQDVTIELDNKRIRPENSEVQRLKCDNTLMRNLTGHFNKYDLENGLKATIDWFQDNHNLRKYKAHIYNV